MANISDVLKTALGINLKKNIYVTPAIKAARFARMVTPMGLGITAAGMLTKKGIDFIKDRRDERDEELEARMDDDFKFLYGDGTEGLMTGYKPILPWNRDANQLNALYEYEKYIKEDAKDPQGRDYQQAMRDRWHHY